VLANGHLVLVLNDSPQDRKALSIALSTDEGITWTQPRVLASSATCDYPAVVQTGDSLIHILFSRDRASIQHITVNESWITGN
jgi:predicted neuraminidase